MWIALTVTLVLSGIAIALIVRQRSATSSNRAHEAWTNAARDLGLDLTFDPAPHLSGTLDGCSVSVRVLSERQQDDEKPYTFYHVNSLTPRSMDPDRARSGPEVPGHPTARFHEDSLVWRKDGIESRPEELVRTVRVFVDALDQPTPLSGD